MVQHRSSSLDASFSALSDVTRRGVLERLARSEESISALAESFDMSLTGMKKHVAILEQAGLVTTEKLGRVRTCRLGRHGYEAEIAWMEAHRRLWTARFDALDKIVEELRVEEESNAPDRC